MEERFFRLGVALAIGLLVGLERGWREREEPPGGRTAGLRTFGIIGLLGGIFAALSADLSAPLIFAAGLFAMAALFGLFQFHESRHEGNFSVTGVMAGLGVFGLGGLAVTGSYQAAAAGGAALAAVLASREILHTGLRQLTWIELRSALVLAVMTTIVLPVLPNRAVDPWGGFNPFEVWLFTVLIATISYAGYIAVRVLGAARGLLVSALAGAVVSSTAVTVALARMARTAPQGRPLAGAAALAGTVSLLRVLVVIAALDASVLPVVAAPVLGAAAVLGGAGLAMVLRRLDGQQPQDMLRNPFELRSLLAFATIFAAVSTLSAGLVERYGGASLALTSALSGMIDVDIAVVSALRLQHAALDPPAIARAILAAIAANAAVRLVLAMLGGPVRFWRPLLAATLAAGLGGWIGYLLAAPF